MERVGELVLSDADIEKALSGDDGDMLVDCIEDMKELTGATRLKITIEAFRE